MRNVVATLILAFALPPAWGATCSYVGLPYTTDIAYLQNYTPPCSTGSCASYTGSMQVTGYIITIAPIPASQTNLEITLSITSFYFSDGVHTFSSTDPLVDALSPFIANTDAVGNITSLSAIFGHWQSSVVPHAVGSRLDYVELGDYNAGLNVHYDQGQTNNYCVAYVNANDSCSNVARDSNSSGGASSPLGTWTTIAVGTSNYEGLWWNPAESGWGINFAHQGDQIFATWYTYDTAGRAWWLSMLAARTSPMSNS